MRVLGLLPIEYWGSSEELLLVHMLNYQWGGSSLAEVEAYGSYSVVFSRLRLLKTTRMRPPAKVNRPAPVLQ